MASPVRKRPSVAVCPQNPEHVLLRSSLARRTDRQVQCDLCGATESAEVKMAASCCHCDVDFCPTCYAKLGATTPTRRSQADSGTPATGSRRCSFAAGHSATRDEDDDPEGWGVLHGIGISGSVSKATERARGFLGSGGSVAQAVAGKGQGGDGGGDEKESAATAAQPRRVSAGTVCLSTSVLGSLNAALAAPTPSEHADLSRDLSA